MTIQANTVDGSDEKQAAIRELISIFLQLNPEPADEQVHSLAAALAVDKEALEGVFYEMLGEAENDEPELEAFTIEAGLRMKTYAGVAAISESGGQGDVGISQDQKVQDGDYDENEIPVDDITINDGELAMDDPDTGFQEETYDDSVPENDTDLAPINTKDLTMNDGIPDREI